MEKNLKTLTDCISKFADINEIQLNNNTHDYDNFGNISINISPNIDISHIGNFYYALLTLSNEEFSPIVDKDHYTGIEKIDYKYDDLIVFHIYIDYVFSKYNKEKTISFVKEWCDETLIDDIIKKVFKLNALGFKRIEFTFQNALRDVFFIDLPSKKQIVHNKYIFNSKLKEYQYELETTQALILAHNQIDKVVNIIENSNSINDAVSKLVTNISFSLKQARFIMDIDVNNLTDDSLVEHYQNEELKLVEKIEEIKSALTDTKLS